MEMGSYEYHTLTALHISDGTIRDIVSVAEFYKDANTPVKNINSTAKVVQKYDATNHHPAVSCESEGVRPSEKPPVVSGGSAKFTADPDETHKKVAKGGQGGSIPPIYWYGTHQIYFLKGTITPV